MQNEASTKERIMRAAARMFSERGYDKVSTREIARAVDINSASIYYYFPSKEEILKSLYNFYSHQRRKQYPDINELMRLAETEPPLEVLMKSEFHYDEENVEILDQIFVVAARRFGADIESERLIRENVFDSIANILKPLLERLVELKRIEPLDIGAFLGILSYYCFSAAALNISSFGQRAADYRSAMRYIYSSFIHCT